PVAVVHAGPPAPGFEAAQHGDPGRIVGLDGFTRRDLGFFGHSHTTVAARRGNGSDATTLKLLERKRELYRAGRPGWVGDGVVLGALQLPVLRQRVQPSETTPCSTWNTVNGHAPGSASTGPGSVPVTNTCAPLPCRRSSSRR